MPARRFIAIPPIAVASLGLTACGGDDKADDTTSTTKASSDSEATETTVAGGETGTTPTTMSAEQFDDAIAEARDQVESAGDDFCKVAAAANGVATQPPADADQAKKLYAIYADIFRQVADLAPADSGLDADGLRDAADKVEAEAETFDAASADPSGMPKTLSDPAVSEMMVKVGEVIQNDCAGAPAGE